MSVRQQVKHLFHLDSRLHGNDMILLSAVMHELIKIGVLGSLVAKNHLRMSVIPAKAEIQDYQGQTKNHS